MNEHFNNPDHTQVSNAYSSTNSNAQSSAQPDQTTVYGTAYQAQRTNAYQPSHVAQQRPRRVIRRRDTNGSTSSLDSTQATSATGYGSSRQAYGQGDRYASRAAYGTQQPYGAAPMAAQAVEAQPKKKDSAISMPVAIGSALSAVTSLFLSSKIGVGGSVVTVAVGAIASSLMQQLYTHLLSKSAEKVRDAASNSANQQIDGVMDSSQLGSYSLTEDATGEAATGTPIAPDEVRDAAAKRHSDVVKKRAIIISVIGALVVVLITAGIITVATQGSGIGTKTTPIIATSTDTTTSDEAKPTEDQPTQSADTTNQSDSSKSGTDTSSTTGKESSTESSSSKSGNTSSSASGTSGTTSSTNSGSSNSGTSSTNSGSNTSGSGSSSSNSSNSGTSSTNSGSSTSGSGSSSTGTSGTSSSSGSSNSGASSNSSSSKSSTSGTTSGTGSSTTSSTSSSN
ncbi:MAG: hypothetical protein ACI360_07270 [Atopobiaceae bacterium]